MGFFKTMATGYQIMGQEAKQKVVDNRANIFTGISVIGTIATGIVSAFSGAKAARKIDAKAAEVQRPLTTKEKAALCWKDFILPAGTVITSSASSITSNRIQAGDIARLTTDVAVVTKAYNEFKKATNEVVTEKQQQQIKDTISEEKRKQMDPAVTNRLVDPDMGMGRAQLFVDGFSGVQFFATVDKVRLAESKLQNMMMELKPRQWLGYYTSNTHGVPYREWLCLIEAETNVPTYNRDISIFANYGWNKGYWSDNIDDDDVISFYLSPGETIYKGEERSCYVINWDQDPADMKCGDMLKRMGVN